MSLIDFIPDYKQIHHVYQHIFQDIHETPIFKSQSINKLVGSNIFFKCENFQKSGSFKIRGATHYISEYDPMLAKHGFICHSSGNHGQAVAFVCKKRGYKAHIVMPKGAPKTKISAIRSYGAAITFCESSEAARVTMCEEIQKKTKAVYIPPFDDYNIIAAQGTLALEFIAQTETLDSLIVPVGGGGLAAGVGIAAHHLLPRMDFFIGEPENVNDTYLSLKAGKIIPNTSAHTVADGLRMTIGSRNFEIVQKHVKEVFTVSENEIIAAMQLIWERLKVVIEPSAAVPFAALLKNKHLFERKRIGIVFTGGNVDFKK